ncbi:MAG: hypothetical protein DHS20C13_07040 [Thermodesulfobacteriota bacterium]|nr:MAG: hypothetical protein DHS20C13_07040 [Thermodesulfobacteriota bacterium]
MYKTIFRIPIFILSFAFFSLFFISQISFAQPYSCLPTCSEIDSKMFVFIGDNPNGIQNTTMNFGITSPANANTVEIGIFDGDSADSDWDLVSGAGINMLFTLFADPVGDGTGTFAVAQWSTDGSAGDNIGDAMPNNAWFTRMVQNVGQAVSENGDYKYNLFVEVNVSSVNDRNSFKIRTDGLLLLFPLQMFSFNSMVTQFSQIGTGTSDVNIVFPDFDMNDPSCQDPLIPFQAFCNATLPSCCLFNSTYDGMWTFFFMAPPDLDRLPIWDGDFDYGSSVLDPNDPNNNTCIIGGPALDTDDPNTGPIIPSFAVGTESVPQGVSIPTDPQDDLCNGFAPRSPSAQYSFIDPNGVVHNNVNPSGNAEWELFSLTDVPPLNIFVDDLLVADLPEGMWQVKTVGLDMYNVNLFFFDYPILGVDEDGDPTVPEEPAQVPTLNEWGLITLSAFVLLLSLYYLRGKRGSATEN